MIKGLSLQDTLFNWLTIQIVVDQRPEDNAAKETCKDFFDALTEDHHVTEFQYEKQDEMYLVKYLLNGVSEQKQFPTELAESLIKSIEDETFYVPGLEDK